jgi:hypothetical protein
MSEAIFGLAGVVVGGLLTAAVTFLFERRQEKREARVARRVMRSELEEATTAIEDALAGGEWPPGWDNKSWSQSWSTYRGVLAATMDDDDFDKLARAYLHMELLQTGLAAGKRSFVEQDETFLTTVNSYVLQANPLLAAGR